MNTRAKGTRFERLVKSDLISKGFFCIRQASSVFPDLIAIKDGRINWLECKVDRKYMSNKEIRALIDLRLKYGGTSFIVYKIREGRKTKIQYEEV